MTDTPTPANRNQLRPPEHCAFARNGVTTCRTTDHCATCDGWPTEPTEEQ